MASIAVIIPTFQPGTYLSECLKSLNDQTISKDAFRVYICLNGDREPYESTIKKLLKYCQFEHEFIYTSIPSVSNARNILIERSKEEFLVFIDDDDVVSDNYLEELLFASSTSIMGISMISNFTSDINEIRRNYIGSTFNKIKKIDTSKLRTRKYFSSPCAKMLHREMIGHIRYDTKVSKGEDSLFMASISPNISAVKKVKGDASYFVRERSGSVTRRKGNLTQELTGLNYVLLQYLRLLVQSPYQKLFILTRVAATLAHYFRLLQRHIFQK